MDLVTGLSGEGLVELVGSTTDLDDFLRRKRIHFQDTGLHPEWSSSKAPKLLEGVRGSLNARAINTTQDMFDQWVTSITNIADTDFLRQTESRPIAERQLLHAYQQLPVEPSFLKFVDKAYELPSRLGDHAFLWNVVQSVDAFRLPVPTQVVAPFERALAFYWTYSHVREYRTSLIGHDYIVGWIDCGIRYDEPAPGFVQPLARSWTPSVWRNATPTGIREDLSGRRYEPLAAAFGHKRAFRALEDASSWQSRSQYRLHRPWAIPYLGAAKRSTDGTSWLTFRGV
jgi:hypothetical protein